MASPTDKTYFYYGAISIAAAFVFICMAYEFSEAQLIWTIIRHY